MIIKSSTHLQFYVNVILLIYDAQNVKNVHFEMLDIKHNSKSLFPYYCKRTHKCPLLLSNPVSLQYGLCYSKVPTKSAFLYKASIEAWAMSTTFGWVTCDADSHKLVVGWACPFGRVVDHTSRQSQKVPFIWVSLCLSYALSSAWMVSKGGTKQDGHNEWGRTDRRLGLRNNQ